jgi:Protein of unknown function (DUF1091)
MKVENMIFDFDKQYINMSMSARNTPPDFHKLIVDYEIVYLAELLRLQTRVKISVPVDKNDEDYTFKIFETAIDKCKIYKGATTTFFARVWMENMNTSNSASLKCPIPKNTVSKASNLTISDTHMLPMPVDARIRVNIKNFGFVKGIKGWTYLFEHTTTGRYKKMSF